MLINLYFIHTKVDLLIISTLNKNVLFYLLTLRQMNACKIYCSLLNVITEVDINKWDQNMLLFV